LPIAAAIADQEHPELPPVRAADGALYQAKDAGRNRVVRHVAGAAIAASHHRQLHAAAGAPRYAVVVGLAREGVRVNRFPSRACVPPYGGPCG
jgi:hypothetical protein